MHFFQTLCHMEMCIHVLLIKIKNNWKKIEKKIKFMGLCEEMVLLNDAVA